MRYDSISKMVLSSVRWTTLNTISQALIQFTILLILARLLSPKDFGLMAMIMVIVDIVNVFARMGIEEAIIFIKNISTKQLSSLYLLSISVGTSLFVFVYMCSSLISSFYAEPDLADLVETISIIFLISSFGFIFEVLLRKNLFFDIYCKINIISNSISFLFIIVLAFYGLGVYALVFGHLFLNTLYAYLLYYSSKKHCWIPELNFSISEIYIFLKLGLYRTLSRLSNQTTSRIDQIIIGAMLGPITLGYYNIAFRLIYLPVQKINPIFSHVAFPYFSKIKEDDLFLKNVFLKYINLIVSINAPILAGLVATSPIFVPLVLGEKWIPAVPILQALAAYSFMRSIFNASGSIVFAKGRVDLDLYGNLILLLIVPVAIFIAIDNTGSVFAACITLSVMFFLYFIFHYFFFLRRLLGPFFIEYILAILKPFLISVTMGLLTYWISLIITEKNSLLVLLIQIAFGLLYYSAATIKFNAIFIKEIELFIPVVASKNWKMWYKKANLPLTKMEQAKLKKIP